MNKLTYNGKVYDDVREGTDKLISASGYIGDSLPAVQLSVDTLTAVVRDYGLQPRQLAAGGKLVAAGGVVMATRESEVGLDKAYKYGTDVQYHHDNNLIGKFRLESIKRVGRYAYQLNCLSDIGLLLTSEHYGGIYTGQTVATVLAEIIGGIVPYTVDAELAETQVYGWLPKASRRDNLRDLLFAIGGQIRKDTVGQINVVPMVEGTPYEISVDDFYMGGSVTGGNPATGVNVTEHTFMALPNDAVVTLFDGESAAEEMVTPMGKTVTGVLVDFPGPMYDLSIENAKILESNANYAVISGSSAAVLTGREYSHTTRVISRRGNTGGAPNIVNASQCTLVSMMNSELVADRLMAYYSSGRTVETDMVVSNQKPGDAVRFTDPFGDTGEGYIADMELNMSAIIKARTTIVTGFIPTASGNNYTRIMVVTSAGTVTIPAECKGKIRVVLIGGGQGGESGAAGTDGGDGPWGSGYGDAGQGGAKGKGGRGGRILVATLSAKPGATFAVTIGTGGVGGVCKGTENTPGAEGKATTFGSLTSADGTPSDFGYTDLINGLTYGFIGLDGVSDGGDGGGKSNAQGETLTIDGVTYYPGTPGNSQSNSGTRPDGGGSWSGTAYGGCGGGPAHGANGEAGTNGSVDYNNGYGFVWGGSGGKGADAIYAGGDGTVPGSGGQGGSGGGGGGAGGGGVDNNTKGLWNGDGGKGGLGSDGGKGAPGLALIYY